MKTSLRSFALVTSLLIVIVFTSEWSSALTVLTNQAEVIRLGDANNSIAIPNVPIYDKTDKNLNQSGDLPINGYVGLQFPYAQNTDWKISRVTDHDGATDQAVDWVPHTQNMNVYAMHGGIVTCARSGCKGSLGYHVSIKHNDGYCSDYSHLQADSIVVRVGDLVYKGQLIGVTGNTGNSFGVHLHTTIYPCDNRTNADNMLQYETYPQIFDEVCATTGSYRDDDCRELVGNIDNANVYDDDSDYQTRTYISASNLADDPRLIDHNLVLNGRFNARIPDNVVDGGVPGGAPDYDGKSQHWTSENVRWEFENMELRFTGTGAGDAVVRQDIYYQTPNNSSFEVRLRLANDSDQERRISVGIQILDYVNNAYDLDDDNAVVYREYTLAPRQAWTDYMFRESSLNKDASPGAIIRLEIRDRTPINQEWILVDDVSVKYLGQNIDFCTPPANIPWPSDVDEDNAFFDEIACMFERDWASGYSDGRWGSDDLLTRGQVAKMISRAVGICSEKGCGDNEYTNRSEPPFPDVDDTNTFYDYIRYLSGTRLKGDPISYNPPPTGDKAIIRGYSDGTFKSDENVRRSELASFLYRTWQWKRPGYSCQENQAYDFSDVPLENPHRLAINCLAQESVINGYSDGTFKPDDPVTRGQAAKMIVRALWEYTEDSSSQPSGDEMTSAAQCAQLSLDQSVYTSTAGAYNEIDCFTVDSIVANSSYFTSISNQGWNADILVEVLKPNGSIEATRSGYAKDGAFGVYWTASEAGIYIVRLTNTDPFAREGVSYSVKTTTLVGERAWRVATQGVGVCGEDGHIQLEIMPLNANDIRVVVEKCDFGRFNESGQFWIYVDGVERWGPFDYSNGSRIIQQTIQPASLGLVGRSDYQIRMRPNRTTNDYFWSGSVRVWDFYSDRNVDWRDIDYRYQVESQNVDCQGILQLTLDARDHRLRASAEKCNLNGGDPDFSSSGRMIMRQLDASGRLVRTYGPFPYEQGDDDVTVFLDPRGSHDDLSTLDLEVWLYSNCDHGVSNCNPNEQIDGGQVRAWSVLPTIVEGRLDGRPWNEVSIWRSLSDAPAGLGKYTAYLPDGQGAWTFYLEKISGYTVDPSYLSTDVYFQENEENYMLRMNAGIQAKLDYMPSCYRLNDFREPSYGGSVSVTTPPNCGPDLYAHGTAVSLEALPAVTHTFERWDLPSESVERSVSSNVQVTMNGDQNIQARFSPICYSLTLVSEPISAGELRVQTPASYDDAVCPDGTYASGTLVSLVANAATGYTFSGWNGTIGSNRNPFPFTINQDTTITAQFQETAPSDTPTPTATSTPDAETQARLSCRLEQSAVQMNAQTRLVIEVVNAVNLFGYELRLSYESTKLQMINVMSRETRVNFSLGDFIYPDFVVANWADNSTGQAQIALTQIGRQPVSGAGELASIAVIGIQPGSTSLTLHDVILSDHMGITQPVTLQGCTVNIIGSSSTPTPTPPVSTPTPMPTSLLPAGESIYLPHIRR